MLELPSRVFLSIVLCLFVSGCGGPEGPELVPVSGKILLDGKPVAGALVRFVPDSGPSSGGETNEQGEFSLIGPGSLPGAITGTHTVTVGCPYNPGQGSSPDGSTQAPSEGPGCSLPLKYSDVSTSGVTAAVPDEGTSELIVQLTSE